MENGYILHAILRLEANLLVFIKKAQRIMPFPK